jgi:hypothetical protein
LRSAPIMTLSFASSNSCWPTTRLPRRAASKGGFVDKVRQIRARKSPACPRAMTIALTFCASGTFFMWTVKNFLAPFHVGQRHHDLTVETSRPQQRGVQNVGAVGRGDQDDAFVRFKPVHFDQQLVECLFALIVTAAETRAAMTSDRIDLIDER